MKDLSSLNDIFKNSIFRIPNYQRGYSWELEQLEEFWDDIYNLPDNNEHYTGMISLKELTLANNKEELEKWIDSEWLLNKDFHAYHVVDGQQRLTTLIILIQVIIEYCREKNPGKNDEEIIMNDTKLSEIIDQFIVKEKPGSESLIKTFLFGYEVDKPSDDYLKNKILNPYYNGEINESFYTLNLDNAKNFFAEKLLSISNPDNLLPIEKIFRKITNKLKFNIYYISDDFNVNVAFETMNNRGKRLSNLELLKNRLIYLTSLLTLPKDEEKTMMTRINDTWKKIYSYLGKNKNETLPDDDFLIAHSYIYFGYIQDIKKGYSQFLLKKYFNQSRVFNGLIYDTFESEIIDDEDQALIEDDSEYIMDLSDKLTKKDILDYIDSLDSLIPHWYEMHFSDYSGDEEINNWLTKLKRLEYNYFKPLVLVCLSKSEIEDAKKLDLIKAIERFIFITFRLCGYQATYNRNNVYNYMHQLYKNEMSIDKIIDKINKLEVLSDNNVLQYSSISSTITRLFKRDGFYGWKANRYFLYEYETSLVKKYSGTTKITDNYFLPPSSTEKLSIEHVFPQSESSEYWLDIFEEYNLEQRNALRGSLGNLLPLSLDINRDLQDYDFDIKKNRYENGSYSEQEVYKIKTWNSVEILERGLRLINFMEERWGFKLVSDSDRKYMLGLPFMIEEGDEYTNYTEVINSELAKEHENYKDIDDILTLDVSGENYAKGYFKDGGIIVLRGSRLRTGVKPGSDSMRIKVEKERTNPSIVDNVYNDDVFYDSPSLAANTILGNHKNGWIAWKNESGVSLDELVGRSKNNCDKLLKGATDGIKEIFNLLNKKIQKLEEDIEIFTTNSYIGYKIERNFLELHVNKNNLLCYTVNGDLYKTNESLEHIPESYGWHVDTKFYITSVDDIDKYWDVIIESINNSK